MRSIQATPELELHVLVAGAHLSPRFGLTIHQIEQDGFPISDRIESLLDSDTPSARIKSAAIQLIGVIQSLERLRPEFILVCGDREEAIVGALAGAYMNIAVAHVAGGDRAIGNVDDPVRHAVTKLAHLHFPLSRESAERLQRMGEESWRIHTVGNPALDRYRILPRLTREDLSRRLDFDIREGPILLVIQHALSSAHADAGNQMRVTLEAIRELGYKALISYPNSDAGGREVIRTIEEFAAVCPGVRVYRSLPRLEFVNLLQTIDVLIGNSSLGLLEAPFLRLPAVNIGDRQEGRQHSDNIISVPHDREAIKKAVRVALFDESFLQKVEACANPFGDGRAGDRIAQVLAETTPDDSVLVKRWAF
jgi:GDP/UDP-N,N'-diacetylbacillosamine 2-epimerase (hydrolysing)